MVKSLSEPVVVVKVKTISEEMTKHFTLTSSLF